MQSKVVMYIHSTLHNLRKVLLFKVPSALTTFRRDTSSISSAMQILKVLHKCR